ncbi:prepilin peptidase [Mariprofundus erugo]|uniref:Prepilin leader peptidase/N-methyltransferase n=1 Tax=Mariprofundus erugo TaxID=2528639 RepID=A0A5R9GPK2_9PROT|nr:prepilin peptidase [Mariprofundus erugo]
MSVFVLICGLLGLLLGSFANVCVHRIPRRESVAFPGSHCPQCSHPIAPYDNIPVLSWLILRGRCRNCHAAIAWRYPLLELLMGISWAGLAWHFGPTLQLGMALTLFFLLWVLSFIDFETGLLPDVLTLPGIIVGLAFSWWLGDWRDAVMGAAAGYGVLWLVNRLFLLYSGREGMGYGDFKLLAMLGAFLGWQALSFVILFSSVIGAAIGSVFLWLARRGMRTEIPFGPYLAAGGMVWLLWGDAILTWYMGMMGIRL